MKLQRYEEKNLMIREAFLEMKRWEPERFAKRLKLSWSNWGFGLEDLAVSCTRLQRYGVDYIELHGNHYGPDLGYEPKTTNRILKDHGLKVSGICGMFSSDNDLSSNRHIQRQAAIDYIRREAAFAEEVGAAYLLVCPAAVGRPAKYDDSEMERSLDSLFRAADALFEHGIRGAIEPIRAAETTLCHTVAEAKSYIDRLNHPGVQHINGDVYHMQSEEVHIGQAIVDAGEMLTNLHMADSNRRALGRGAMDIDTIIMALYMIGYQERSCAYVTPEPLGPGSDPYPAQYGKTPPEVLDQLVSDTVTYFREREDAVLSL